MKTLKKILLGLTIASALCSASYAQSSCATFLNMRKAAAPYRYNTASKSATCFSGKKYEFLLPLTKGNEYRLQFFASPVFNNEVQVKIVDMNTSETIIDLPGHVENGMEPKKGNTILQDYMDSKTNKLVHPFFDIVPQQSTSLKIMIEIKDHYDYTEEAVLNEWGEATGETVKKPIIPEGGPEVVKGCFGVYITDKPSDTSSF
jgi:hypothetical protein